MSLDVGFHPLAAVEIVDAEFWYEQQSEGLGDRFLGAVEATATRVSRWPNVGTRSWLPMTGRSSTARSRSAGFRGWSATRSWCIEFLCSQCSISDAGLTTGCHVNGEQTLNPWDAVGRNPTTLDTSAVLTVAEPGLTCHELPRLTR